MLAISSVRRTPILFSLIQLCIVACAEPENTPAPKTEFQVSEISDFPFTIQDKDAVFINFSSPNTGECSLTLARENIREGKVIELENGREGEVDLNCLKSEKLFLMTDAAPTSLHVKHSVVNSRSIQTQINATLYSVRTKDFLTLSNALIVVEGNFRKKVGSIASPAE